MLVVCLWYACGIPTVCHRPVSRQSAIGLYCDSLPKAWIATVCHRPVSRQSAKGLDRDICHRPVSRQSDIGLDRDSLPKAWIAAVTHRLVPRRGKQLGIGHRSQAAVVL
eukprot:362655-Chlamydomonas_euryale.AAC.10